MGLMDKVKAQATQVAHKAQEAGKEGKAKLDAAQGKKRGDALLRDLGAAFYADKTGKGTGETSAEIERLLAELRAHESEHGAVDVAPTAGAAGGAGAATEGGDFKLDDM
jgi:hypothetical protein